MQAIHIVTDSTVQFPTPGFTESHPITIVPIRLEGLDEEHAEAIDTDLDSLRPQFEDPGRAPIIRPPSLECLVKTYQQLQGSASAILSIHSTSAVSNLVEVAKTASEHFLGRCDILVIDSEMISVGLGLIVEAAVRAASRGNNLEEIVRLVRGMIPRLYAIFCLEDLMYLERHALVSLSQAILGNMLGVIPFLTLEGGRLVPMEKVRSRQRAIEKLVEFVSEFTSLDYVALLHDQQHATGEIRLISDRLKELNPATPLMMGNYNPPLATYLGLNSLGLVVLESEEEAAG